MIKTCILICYLLLARLVEWKRRHGGRKGIEWEHGEGKCSELRGTWNEGPRTVLPTLGEGEPSEEDEGKKQGAGRTWIGVEVKVEMRIMKVVGAGVHGVGGVAGNLNSGL